MLLGFTSDIHIDYHLEAAGLIAGVLAEQEPEVFVVAGDVTPDMHLLEKTLSILAEAKSRVLFVPGNHDLWCRSHRFGDEPPRGVDSLQRYEKVLPKVVSQAGAVYLPGSPYIVEGIGFVGVTGWYDWSLRNVELEDVLPMEVLKTGKYSSLEWMDGVCSYWGGKDGVPWEPPVIVDYMAEKLNEGLSFLEPRVDRIVVVTHFFPYAGLSEPIGEPRHDFVLAHAGSSKFGRIIDGYSKVKRVISGHIHKPIHKKLRGDDLIFQSSPIGYPKEIALALFQHVRERVCVVNV